MPWLALTRLLVQLVDGTGWFSNFYFAKNNVTHVYGKCLQNLNFMHDSLCPSTIVVVALNTHQKEFVKSS